MKKFKVTVQFDIKNPTVADCLMNNFDLDSMDDTGTVEMWYTSRGNKNSSAESAMRGMKQILNGFTNLKRGFKILSAKEIQQ